MKTIDTEGSHRHVINDRPFGKYVKPDSGWSSVDELRDYRQYQHLNRMCKFWGWATVVSVYVFMWVLFIALFVGDWL